MKEENFTRNILHCTGFCILNNNKILFGISQTEFSFVIENRDMTDFYIYFTLHHFFLWLILAPLIRS